MAIQFRRQELEASMVAPEGSEVRTRVVEIRYDPLLGTSSRIAEGVKLQTGDRAALEPLRAPDPTCPFCAERLERVTPRIDPRLGDEPRIVVGEAVVFPNLVPYSQYAAVAIFARRHWLDIEGFTAERIADNLRASVRYVRAVHAADPRARHAAWNVNYLFPSGGSLPHAHAQVFLDPIPTTRMRLQQEAAERYARDHGVSYWEDLVATERTLGERFLWDIGATSWMTAFAPVGFHEVQAVVRGRASMLELDDEDVVALATGLERVLRGYASLGFNSFNVSLFSGPLDGSAATRVHLAMVTRTAMLPYYRSDAMYLERLHWEAAVDRAPEEVAERLRAAAA
ncbi:MAG: hypothetical protein P8Y02_11655 [Deinococcales bacterium]